ncbi:MAG: Sir2 family NAD-dependent protein deacetylase [Holophagae bacterium]|jgi:NAD-dependent SIR2 family protein deacetylase
MDLDTASTIESAARAVADADALLITAGAGMGVDSGLPDFRGDAGFWKTYPPLKQLGISFVDMANPGWFSRDPELAWGFYGHRLNLYRSTTPHQGFQILKRWAESAAHGGFVFTSNVDGQFQAAGFSEDQLLECHGSISHLQCTTPCCDEIWSADELHVEVDDETFRTVSELPACEHCVTALARPNVLMFGDWHWAAGRTAGQEGRFQQWLQSAAGPSLVIVEMGAGSAVPTVRMTSERVARACSAKLIRINPREPQVPYGQIGIEGNALETLEAIDQAIATRG